MSPSVPPTGSAEELKQVEAATSTVPVQLELLHSYCTTSAQLPYYFGTATVLLRHTYCTTVAQLMYFCGTATVPLLLQVELWHSYVNWEKSNPLKVG